MMPYRNPGIYSDTPSFCSKFYTWFQELGYPQLDLLQYEDGEWSIIEMLRTPVIPSLTPWKHVLMGIQNTEISFAFIKKYVELLDITKQAYWDHELGKSEAAIKQSEDVYNKRLELSQRAAAIIGKNDHLKERIAKHGMREALPWHVAKHIAPSQFKQNFKG